MNRRRCLRTWELREPEKTALIDIIFLLLIFFFVSLSTLEPAPYGQKGGGERLQRERELPRIVKPDPLTGQFLLIRVIDLSQAPTVLRINVSELRNACQALSQNLNLGIFLAQVPQNGFMVLVDDNDYHNDIDSLLMRARDLQVRFEREGPIPQLEAEASTLCGYYPVFYPALGAEGFQDLLPQARQRLGQMLETKLRSLGGTASHRAQIHVQMPKTTYMWFLKSLFGILGERGLSGEDIRIHALEEYTQ